MTLVATAFPDDDFQNGTIVVSRDCDAIGRIAVDDAGFATVIGRQHLSNRTIHFSTHYAPISEIEQYWRLATDEEVCRYFDAD